MMFIKALADFLSLPFQELNYSAQDRAISVGVILGLTILISIAWRFFAKRRYSQKQAGYEIPSFYRRGVINRLIHILPIIGVILVILGFLVALAEPFTNRVREEIQISESRIRVDIKDTSSSMEQVFPGTDKSKAQIAADAHAEFVRLRAGKQDRVSLWLFASFPYLIEDFIVDDELYLYQVIDAPWLTWSGNIYSYIEDNPTWPIPADRYNIAGNDTGGTELRLILQAVIKQFDNDPASRRAKNKSILIISDGQPNESPIKELAELKKRSVTVYMILINDLPDGSLPPLMNEIKQFGGEYFDVKDQNSLRRAFAAIDRHETVSIERRNFTFREYFFQEIILASILLLFVAITVGLFLEPFGVYP